MLPAEKKLHDAAVRLLHSSFLSEKTHMHCIATAYYMEELAELVPLDPHEAWIAGLLHDICKARNEESLLASAEEYGIPINEAQRHKPKLLHGPVAAEKCRRALGISDAIYEAIYWHTTGHPGLGPMGLALFFADFSEPLRSHANSVKAGIMLHEVGFKRALRFVADRKLEYILTKRYVDPETQAFHAWLTSVIDA